jgi:hypothetical protein
VTTSDKIWTRYDIKPNSNGKAKVIMTTNDNNMDGCPDGWTASWCHETDIWIALELAGSMSHTGIFGETVDVFVNDEKVTSENLPNIKKKYEVTESHKRKHSYTKRNKERSSVVLAL